MRKLEGWCTRSQAPVDNFTALLLQFEQYRDTCWCGSRNYIQLLLPDKGKVCVHLSFKLGGAYVVGIQKAGCEGGTFRAAR